MPPPHVDIVFVVDASSSMIPCFDGLRKHLGSLVQAMEGCVSKIHYGLVAHSTRGDSYRHIFLCGSGIEDLMCLYQRNSDYGMLRERYFTDDPQHFIECLQRVTPTGNENSLVALDIALDFPFASPANTKRVIALFSDEPFETGNAFDAHNRYIPDLIEKIHARRIMLFCAVPNGPGIQELAAADGSEIVLIDDDDVGLERVNFQQLLFNMGKSISRSLLQRTGEPAYKQALFEQNIWNASNIWGPDE